jgi:hypothetical protein
MISLFAAANNGESTDMGVDGHGSVVNLDLLFNAEMRRCGAGRGVAYFSSNSASSALFNERTLSSRCASLELKIAAEESNVSEV